MQISMMFMMMIIMAIMMVNDHNHDHNHGHNHNHNHNHDHDTENDTTSLSRETCLLLISGEALARLPRGAPRLRSRLLLSSPSILPGKVKVGFFFKFKTDAVKATCVFCIVFFWKSLQKQAKYFVERGFTKQTCAWGGERSKI